MGLMGLITRCDGDVDNEVGWCTLICLWHWVVVGGDNVVGEAWNR